MKIIKIFIFALIFSIVHPTLAHAMGSYGTLSVVQDQDRALITFGSHGAGSPIPRVSQLILFLQISMSAANSDVRNFLIGLGACIKQINNTANSNDRIIPSQGFYGVCQSSPTLSENVIKNFAESVIHISKGFISGYWKNNKDLPLFGVTEVMCDPILNLFILSDQYRCSIAIDENKATDQALELYSQQSKM